MTFTFFVFFNDLPKRNEEIVTYIQQPPGDSSKNNNNIIQKDLIKNENSNDLNSSSDNKKPTQTETTNGNIEVNRIEDRNKKIIEKNAENIQKNLLLEKIKNDKTVVQDIIDDRNKIKIDVAGNDYALYFQTFYILWSSHI
jgi:hypothetical protein